LNILTGNMIHEHNEKLLVRSWKVDELQWTAILHNGEEPLKEEKEQKVNETGWRGGEHEKVYISVWIQEQAGMRVTLD
jgi:hypothetical protein